MSVEPKVRLLVVDDEPGIRQGLRRALELSGYHAEAVEDGAQALARLRSAPYDLMVLDLHLPDMAGEEVMAQARALRPALLILILTGYGTLDSAIAAVRGGAVDYLLKPASVQQIADVVARSLERHADQQRGQLLHALTQTIESLRGATPPPVVGGPVPDNSLHVGSLTLELSQRRVSTPDSDAPIELTEGECAILEVMMRSPATVLSCAQLTQAAWGYEQDEYEAQSIVRPYIFRLRHKLEPVGAADLIRTVRGRGYLIEPRA